MKFNENRSKGSGDKEWTQKCYGWNDGLTDEGHSYNPPSASLQEIKNSLKRI